MQERATEIYDVNKDCEQLCARFKANRNTVCLCDLITRASEDYSTLSYYAVIFGQTSFSHFTVDNAATSHDTRNDS